MRSDVHARRRHLVLTALLLVGTAVAGIAHAQNPALRASVANALVVPDEERFEAYRWPREPRVIALYFGADWCTPCHAFMPELKQVYAALRSAGADTEVVYVSLDTSEREMRRYMRRQSMPWPAIDYRRLKALPAIRALGGPAPPNLVLIDRDGTVIASGWHGRRYAGLQPVLTAWVRALSDAGSPAPAPTPESAPAGDFTMRTNATPRTSPR
ncbi:thioredoxin-like domain-containing protein [Luteimonas salinilitoris]|uniref:Thioredoxin-like domain-containing protein n=1 Tax=Luteimonas salinilitoris TaxID=3237697 RepID=A0ABV4HZ87_9GAMM